MNFIFMTLKVTNKGYKEIISIKNGPLSPFFIEHFKVKGQSQINSCDRADLKSVFAKNISQTVKVTGLFLYNVNKTK